MRKLSLFCHPNSQARGSDALDGLGVSIVVIKGCRRLYKANENIEELY